MENYPLIYSNSEEVLFEFEVNSSGCLIPQDSTLNEHQFQSNQLNESNIGADETLLDLDQFFAENAEGTEFESVSIAYPIHDAHSNQILIESDANFLPFDNGCNTQDSIASGDDATPNEIVRAIKIKKTSKREQARLQRESGSSYLGYSRKATKVVQDTFRPPRNQGPPCVSSFCRKSALRHCNVFTEDQRSSLFQGFWEMGWPQKQIYVCNLMEETNVKQRRAVGEESRRNNSFKFFLKTFEGKIVQVCRKFFLSTLGLKQKMVKIWFNDIKKFGLRENPKAVQKRKNTAREKSASHQALLNRKIKLLSFLIDYPKLESHYCRKDTDKEYFETEHRTLIDLYKQYVAVCDEENSLPLSFPVFSGTMKNLNFSIFKPRKDQCDTCSAYKVGNVDLNEFNSHRKNVDRAAKEKEMDVKAAKLGLIILLCMDTEAVVLCPKVSASAQYYKSKLQLHNFTMYDILSHDSTNYIWDETESDLQSSSFTSIVIHHLEPLMKSSSLPIIIYSDGCGYQNRNVILSNALRLLAMKHSRNITQKFLEVGHTHMECDSCHACIERKTRDMTFNLPCDFEKAVKEARDKPFPYAVQRLTHTFFLNYDDKEYLTLSSIRPGKKAGDPKVNDLRCLQYTADGKVMFKLDFDDCFEELPQKVTERTILEPKRLHQGRLPVTFSKWNHLQELKVVLDPLSHYFYDDIPHFEGEAKINTESEKLQKLMQKVHLVKKIPKAAKVAEKTKGTKKNQKTTQKKINKKKQ